MAHAYTVSTSLSRDNPRCSPEPTCAHTHARQVYKYVFVKIRVVRRFFLPVRVCVHVYRLCIFSRPLCWREALTRERMKLWQSFGDGDAKRTLWRALHTIY